MWRDIYIRSGVLIVLLCLYHVMRVELLLLVQAARILSTWSRQDDDTGRMMTQGVETNCCVAINVQSLFMEIPSSNL